MKYLWLVLLVGCYPPECAYRTVTRTVVRVDTAQAHSVRGPGCSALFTDGSIHYSGDYCVLLQPGDSVKVPE